MPDFALPFPDKELAQKELTYDPCYGKIAEEARERIVEEAWQKGTQAAVDIWKKYNGETDFFKIAVSSGLHLEHVNIDYIIGSQRYFSDYISGQNKINFYIKSIALWANENHLTQEQAENLILSHEYFHFLEWNTLGLTSKLYQVPMAQIGRLKFGRTGIRALSEIGAHAFARAYYELTKKEETDHADKTTV
jgi:hypothetical protein